jgi:hypothetical protein
MLGGKKRNHERKRTKDNGRCHMGCPAFQRRLKKKAIFWAVLWEDVGSDDKVFEPLLLFFGKRLESPRRIVRTIYIDGTALSSLKECPKILGGITSRSGRSSPKLRWRPPRSRKTVQREEQ